MKQSWKEGKIEPNIHSINESKKERELKKIIEENTNLKVQKKTIKIGSKWCLPDIIVDNKIIVEFYGDFWHAHHDKYKSDDIVHHGKTAKEIRQHDVQRKKQLEKAGYIFHVVWEKDFDNDKNKVLKEIKTLISTYGRNYKFSSRHS